ncbi:MAG TPA: DUF192 domain-containing protein [Steroidobacteraceae bacterium]|nr:DUF192 domain-containing protein [Steroidobacteraceae bacterium]
MSEEFAVNGRSVRISRAVLPLALAALWGLGLCGAAVSPAQNAPLQDLATYPRTMLTIRSGKTQHTFSVWVADTAPRQTQGLMYVRDLPADRGMLFTDCCTGIWMRNTYIELDIVFVGTDGRIAKIAEHAHPFDETTIPAGGPMKAVVELRGGVASELKLKTGDEVSWQPTTDLVNPPRP